MIVIAEERRMTNFVVGLTNDDPSVTAPVYKQYHYVQYSGRVPANGTVSVSFPLPVEKYRYVVIQNKFTQTEALCLAEVKVFARGIYSNNNNNNNTTICKAT